MKVIFVYNVYSIVYFKERYMNIIEERQKNAVGLIPLLQSYLYIILFYFVLMAYFENANIFPLNTYVIIKVIIILRLFLYFQKKNTTKRQTLLQQIMTMQNWIYQIRIGTTFFDSFFGSCYCDRDSCPCDSCPCDSSLAVYSILISQTTFFIRVVSDSRLHPFLVIRRSLRVFNS